MQGKVTVANNEYEWWAGKASDEADSEYCVHCRQDGNGATRYMDSSPSEADAESIAKELAPVVANMH